MTKEQWVTAALTNDAMVAELLIRMKQPSSSDSSFALPPPTTLLPPISWGHRKSRSKPSAITTTTIVSCLRKEQQSGSPTTPLCWSSGGGGGGGASTSDGYDESSRPSDLSSGGRSTKGALGNEGATTSSYKKSRKRKSFAELKEEEDFLLKERLHLNRELESMRVTMNRQIATSQNLRKLKIDFHHNPKTETTKTSKTLDDEPRPEIKMTGEENHRFEKSRAVQLKIEGGFVLPDLNMIPDAEEL